MIRWSILLLFMGILFSEQSINNQSPFELAKKPQLIQKIGNKLNLNEIELNPQKKQDLFKIIQTQCRLDNYVQNSSPLTQNNRNIQNFSAMNQSEIVWKAPKNQIKMTYLQYRQQFGRKDYYLFKHYIFLQNLKRINKHNADPQRKFDLDINSYTDVGSQQFRDIFGYKNTIFTPTFLSRSARFDLNIVKFNNPKVPTIDQQTSPKFPQIVVNSIMPTGSILANQVIEYNQLSGLPYKRINKVLIGSPEIQRAQNLNINLREYAGPLRQQLQCKACYAFAVLDAIWIRNNILNKKQLTEEQQEQDYYQPFFSVQQIIQCASRYTFFIKGCQGGSIYDVYKYIKDYGINYQQDNQYQKFLRGRSIQCKNNTLKQLSKKFKIKRFQTVEGQCLKIILALSNLTPVTVTIPMSSDIYLYSGNGPAPYYKQEINSNTKYHSVVVLGYDRNNGYLFKNTWGRTWGIKGYGYLNSLSKLCDNAYYPVF